MAASSDTARQSISPRRLDRKHVGIAACAHSTLAALDIGAYAGAYILSERGFDAYVLKGGLATTDLMKPRRA